MMLDDLEPNESRANEQPARRPSDAPAPAQRPVSDREVPLTGRTAMADIHAWLDGDLPETAVRRADTAHDIEFWNRLEKDVEVRRQMKTPVHVYAQIMDSLPQTVPQPEPWWRTERKMSLGVLVAAGAGLLALGVIVGVWLLR